MSARTGALPESLSRAGERGFPSLPVVALHGSAVIAPGGVLLFLGHGGAGKSTICQLLAGHFPKLSDDAVYLAGQGDGEWCVTNADQRAFAGPLREGELEGREWTVLRAVVRIFQSPTTRLVPVTSLAACRHIRARGHADVCMPAASAI